MILKMFNVGFGDCFLFLDGDNSLWVDCGSKSFNPKSKSNHILKLLIDQTLYKYYGNKNSSALITHFHGDHYNGFRYLAETKNEEKIFDKIYVPYLDIEDEKTGESMLLEVAICCYTFLNKFTYSHIISKNILKHIEMVTKLANNIEYLSTGKKIKFGNLEFDVIWPDKKYDFTQFKFKDFLDKIDSILILKGGQLFNEFNALKKKILKNMKEWYVLTEHPESDMKNFNTIIRTQNSLIGLEDASYYSLEGFRRRNNINLSTENTIKKFIPSYTSLFSKSNNSTSIVFHDKNRKILMTGDVERSIINKLNLQDSYQFLKVPHHGTSSHYTDSLPAALHFLISTGKGRVGKIGVQYMTHSCPLGKRYCTSGGKWCNTIDNKQICFNNSCLNNQEVTLPL
ncbi:MAG: hypothetical protein WC614_01520 [bacterium]